MEIFHNLRKLKRWTCGTYLCSLAFVTVFWRQNDIAIQYEL